MQLICCILLSNIHIPSRTMQMIEAGTVEVTVPLQCCATHFPLYPHPLELIGCSASRRLFCMCIVSPQCIRLVTVCRLSSRFSRRSCQRPRTLLWAVVQAEWEGVQLSGRVYRLYVARCSGFPIMPSCGIKWPNCSIEWSREPSQALMRLQRCLSWLLLTVLAAADCVGCCCGVGGTRVCPDAAQRQWGRHSNCPNTEQCG